MGLYFSRLFLWDQYSVAPDKFVQKQLENAGQCPDCPARRQGRMRICRFSQFVGFPKKVFHNCRFSLTDQSICPLAPIMMAMPIHPGQLTNQPTNPPTNPTQRNKPYSYLAQYLPLFYFYT